MTSIDHEFKLCVEEKSTIGAQNNKSAIIVVGSTGTGKSSLIKLFCGNNVIIGHNTSSQTSKSTLFNDILNNNRYWLDSQGANDSNGIDDDKVLTDILKALYYKKISNIHIIWCVSGDMCREKKEFQIQAKFIKSLGNNAWNSCLIIKKCGRPNAKKLNGILAAIKRYGMIINYGDKRLFGFTALQHVNCNDDDLLNDINNEYKNNPTKIKEKYKKFGYLNNNQIVHEINTKLSQLPSLKIKFEIKKCVKCGNKGDPRFVYEPCHVRSQMYHPKQLIQYHNGTLQRIHIGVVKTITIRDVEWYHPKSFDSAGIGTGLAHVFTFGISTGVKAINGTLDGDYPCCGKGIKGSGCCSRMIVKGSQYKWSCCDQDQHTNGCREQYNCCDGTTRSQGCKRKYLCCDKTEGSIGCKKRCQSCHIEWGNGPGCIKTTTY